MTPKTLMHRRKAWAKAKGLDPAHVAIEIKLNYITVYNWFHKGAQLRELYADRVLSVFPDFPVS